MQNKEYYNEAQVNFEPEPDPGNRRNVERRKDTAEGFSYVSTVGWICRREQCRRKDDPFDFNT